MKLLITGGSGFIGTSLTALADRAGADWLNADVVPPVSGCGFTRWRRLDILQASELESAVSAFAPTHVLHLAARTDTASRSLADYEANTVGTVNVLRAATLARSVRRFVFVSSQFVLGPGVTPRSDVQFAPHTAYGESKVVGELLTRASPLPWVIVRPTNVWGPWHPRYPREFWNVLSRGLYLHPAGRPARKTYGYVTNVCAQMWAALTLPADRVLGKVFYLGDPPIDLKEWADAFSNALVGRPVRVVPTLALRALALVGDVGRILGLRFPLTSTRFHSMTQDYLVPIDESLETLGRPAKNLQTGVEETVRWLRGQAA